MDFTKKIGLWIHNPETAIGRLHEIQGYDFDYILAKISNGKAGYFPALTQQIIRDAHTINLPVTAWSYIYANVDPVEQVKAIKFNLPSGCIDVVLDAEGDWEGSPMKAKAFMQEFSAQLPGIHAHLSSFYAPALHSDFPWKEFLPHCHSFMPQAYQEGHTTTDTVRNRMNLSAIPRAMMTIDRQIIPTVNSPEMMIALSETEKFSRGMNVWLWDGTGAQNSQINTAGDDEGVRTLHGIWLPAIQKLKQEWAK